MSSPSSAPTDEPDEGPAERLALDGAIDDVATARRIAIAAVVISAALLAALARTWWAYGLAALSLVAVRFWVKRVTEARAETRGLAGRALELRPDRLVVPRADGSEEIVRRGELARVEIDHERLLVILRHHDQRELEIEPSFGGLGLDGLGRRLERWRTSGR